MKTRVTKKLYYAPTISIERKKPRQTEREMKSDENKETSTTTTKATTNHPKQTQKRIR